MDFLKKQRFLSTSWHSAQEIIFLELKRILDRLKNLLSKGYSFFKNYLLVPFILIIVIFCLIIFIVYPGYTFGFFAYKYAWTGLGEYSPISQTSIRAKTLWDWLELVIIPIVIAIGAYLFTQTERLAEREREERKSNLEKELELDRAREALLISYLDKISTLMLEYDLCKSDDHQEVRRIARTYTLNVLRLLDGNRKGVVVSFLYDSSLVNHEPVVDLGYADLEEVNLDYLDLQGISLKYCNLRNAKLQGANLGGADLTGAILIKAELKYAVITNANLTGADMRWSNCHKLQARGSNLTTVDLRSSDLSDTILKGATLTGANLNDCNTENTIFDENQLSSIHSMQKIR